jgi:N-acylglucosamine 2-epimerase
MLQQIYERYQAELFQSIVPFWLQHAPDPQYGGYFTCLDRDGSVYDTRKYVWLQGRAVWTFSKLYNEISKNQEWLRAATSGVEFLLQHAFDEQGRCYFSLDRAGHPVAFQRKPYGAVFVAAGLHEYSEAVGDARLRSRAIDLVMQIHGWIGNPSMLGRPLFPGQTPTSKLADVMVMVMLLLELMAKKTDPAYRSLLQLQIEAALKHHDQSTNVFLENVAMSGEFLKDSPDGRLFNPGHSIEMAWFLLLAFRHVPSPVQQQRVLKILASSLERGWDEEFGGLFYFMDIENRPPLQLEATMKLWWPHTEALYAVILAYSLTHDAYWLAWIQRLDNYVFRHFADPKFGEWFGYCDRQGGLTNSCKGNHYKGFFHVPRALLYSLQELDKMRQEELRNQTTPPA